jgi:STE24 endopeptidase
MVVDAWGFDVDRQAKARSLRGRRVRLTAARTSASVVLVLGLILGGSAILRDGVLALGWPSWASAILFLTFLYALFLAIDLPFSYLGGYRLEKASGLSSQSLRGWMKDLGKTMALGLGASVVVGGILLGLLAASPTWWWVAAWVLGLVGSALIGFLGPVLLVPLFYRFRPLNDAGLRARFESLAAKAHVPILGVFELRASDKTRRSNAAVMGLGRTRRVVVTDTLIRAFTPEEVDTVLAHELAHQRYMDPLRGFFAGSLVSFGILALVAWAYPGIYPAFGIRSAGDMAGLPLLVTIFSLFALPFRPVELFTSRSRESRADRFSLELTHDAGSFVAAMVKLHDLNLGVADPRPWEKWLLYSHPTGRERVEMARGFRASST